VRLSGGCPPLVAVVKTTDTPWRVAKAAGTRLV
jgi:hypothetical protein